MSFKDIPINVISKSKYYKSQLENIQFSFQIIHNTDSPIISSPNTNHIKNFPFPFLFLFTWYNWNTNTKGETMGAEIVGQARNSALTTWSTPSWTRGNAVDRPVSEIHPLETRFAKGETAIDRPYPTINWRTSSRIRRESVSPTPHNSSSVSVSHPFLT